MRRGLLVLLAPTVLAWGFGCNAVLGNEQRYLTSEGAAGTTGGQVDDGGNGATSDATNGSDASQNDAPGTDGGDQAAIGVANAQCIPDNAYACAGHAQKGVLSCNPTTHVWTALQPCAGQLLCDTTPGPNQGSCQDPAPGCAGKIPGDKFCSGTQSVTCGPDLVTSTSEVCPKLCVGNGQCVACTAMSKQCSGNNVETCQMDGTWGAPVACPKACIGSGECGACTPMDKTCSNNGVETCQMDGTWGAPATCANQACVNGGCTGVCSPNAIGCSGLQPQKCDANGAWQSNGTACANQACVTGGCTGVCSPNPTPTFCSNNTPQFCDTNGAWQNSGAACSNMACVSGACVGVCTPASKRCSGNGVQTCQSDGTWGTAVACAGATPVCNGGACTVGGPSCTGLAATCGPGASGNCCAANVVTGGTFNRGNDPNYPATVSDFRLDNYEITVGRFRKFVAAYTQAMTAASAGKNPNNGSDPGWNVAWNASLPVNAAALMSSVKCHGTYQTWTDTAGTAAAESRPITCVDWYEVSAFCIWDGGRLPTEAEWNYATAGGNEHRQYPWGAAAPDCTYANYGGANFPTTACVVPGTGGANSVGSESPKGDGKYGQSDLAGNAFEWTLDWYASYANPCTNCANATVAADRVIRGGGFIDGASTLLSPGRYNGPPTYRNYHGGARCARTP